MRNRRRAQRQESAPTPVQIRSLSVDGGAARKNTGTVKWDYPRPGTPENWADLSEEFRTCAEGVEQSPVDLTGYTTVDAAPIVFHYAGVSVAARNDGHTVYLDYGEGDSIDVGGRRYDLQGIHSHSPGEHLLDGEVFAAELHPAHRDSEGNLTVVGLLFRIGEHSPFIQNLLDVAPDAGGPAGLNGGPAATDYVPANLIITVTTVP